MQESRTKNFCWTYQTQIGVKGEAALQPPTIRTVCKGWVVGRTGGSKPGWRQLIANIQDASTVFTGTNVKLIDASMIDVYVEIETTPGTRNRESWSGFLPFVGASPDPSTISSSVAENHARRSLLSDVQGRRSAFQGGAFVAEIRDTIHGILHPAKALREGLTLYHQKAKKLSVKMKGAKLREALAGTWLEAQFGWRPLAMDLEQAAENLQKISGRPRPIHFRASGADRSMAANVGYTGPTENLNLSIQFTKATESICYCTYQGAYKVKPPQGWDLESWGLSTQDFLPSVWEAIPYSFAVDYFTNIGQIISAYSYLYSDIAWVCKTVRKEMIVTLRGVKLSPGNGSHAIISQFEGGLGLLSISLTSIFRSPASVNELIPRLEIRVPGLGSTRWLNIAALASLRIL